jgi:hypothetical protein
VVCVYTYLARLQAEKRAINAPTGSSPMSSKVLFWRRPRPGRG